MSSALVETGDGRTLAYEEIGDPDGVPVFMLHGTPGSRLSGRHPDPARVTGAGLRLITYDRPGYGKSARQRGRSVVDCVGDVAAIADRLGVERFTVTGGSGGGPHALALAARLPDRVIRAECNVGAAPFDAEGLDWVAGMDPKNVEEVGWALAGEATLTRELEREARVAMARLDEDPAAMLADFDLSASDRAVLEDRSTHETMRAAFRAAVAGGVWGWVDDDLAFLKPWGFELDEIRVPVQIRYGAGDVLVPAAHGAWLAAHVPGAVVTVDEDAGHLTTPDERLERLQALVKA